MNMRNSAAAVEPASAKEKLRPEKGLKCVGCGSPVQVGQCVLIYDDAGEVHADCTDPWRVVHAREAEQPTFMLIGRPMILLSTDVVPQSNPLSTGEIS